MSPQLPVYLDYCATTPTDPRVVETMLPYFSTHFGNPSNTTHAYGQAAAVAHARARYQLAELMDCSPNEVIFTSGATESNNLVFKGLAQGCCSSKREVITLESEHKSILKSAECLSKQGFTVHYAPIKQDGIIDMDAFENLLSEHTALVSIMYVNNETGVIQPIEAIAELCKRKGVFFHCDAVQALGKIRFSLKEIPIDFLSASGHKMYGPKGVGLLYVRQQEGSKSLLPCIDGGGQEFGLRSGTQNVPGIVGFGKAAELALAEMADEHARLHGFFERFLDHVLPAVPGLALTGSRTQRYVGNIHLNLKGVGKKEVMPHLTELAISTGSACNSGQSGVSHVMQAMGYNPNDTLTSLRLSMGRFTTEAEMIFAQQFLVKQLNAVLNHELETSPFIRT